MRIAAAAFLLLVPRLALAEYAPADVEEVPIARIAENLERTLKADPQDRTALLNLARLNAMAFAAGPVTTVQRGTLELRSEYPTGRLLRSVPKQPPPKERRHYLDQALRLYRLLLEREPTNAEGRLGLGYCLLLSGDKARAASVLRKLLDELAPQVPEEPASGEPLPP